MVRRNFNLRTYNSVKRHLQKCAWAIEVVDARSIKKTRIPRLEEKFLDKLFIAATKSDLLGKIRSECPGLKAPVFYVSSKTKKGIAALKSEIKKVISKKLLSREPPIDIFIFGIPNVGKSSLLNSLAGKKAAKTGFRSGITRGIQWIRFSENSRLVDAPGVTAGKIDEGNLGEYAAIDAQKIKNPFALAKKLIRKNPEKISKFYRVLPCADAHWLLDRIAHKRKLLLKGGEPDTDSAAKLLILDFQKGKIRA